MMEPKFRTAWNTYVINNRDKDNFKKYIKYASADSSHCSPTVTFLCGSEEISVSSILAGIAFPALRDVLKSFQSGQCSCDLLFRNEATIFISLDGDIDINMLWMLKQIVTMSLSEVKMTSFQLGQLRDLMGMLGMSMNLLKFEELVLDEHGKVSKDEEMQMHTSRPKYEEVLEIDISSPPETEGSNYTLDEITEAEVEVRQSEKAEIDQNDMVTPFSEEVEDVLNDSATLHQEEKDVASSNIQVFPKEDDKYDEANHQFSHMNNPFPAAEVQETDQQASHAVTQLKGPKETQKSDSSQTSNTLETSPLRPKRSGKRKTIDDAIENIAAVAKKKAKDEVNAVIPETLNEEKLGNMNETGSIQNPGLLGSHSNQTIGELEEKEVSPNVKTFEMKGEGLSKINPPEYDDRSNISNCPEPTCKNSIVTFKNKTELLNHVAVAHFQVTLLEAYPYRKNVECSLCISNEAKKTFSAKTKTAWLAHIVTHTEILDVLPDSITEAVKLLPKRARNQNKTARKDPKMELEPEEEFRNLDETEPIPDQFSDGPLATSYVEPSFDFETLSSAPVAEVLVANSMPASLTSEKSASEGEDSEMRRMSLYKMDSVPASMEEMPRPLAQSSVALASLPRQLESFPQPLAQSSSRDILADIGHEETKGVNIQEDEEVNLAPLMEIANEGLNSNDEHDAKTSNNEDLTICDPEPSAENLPEQSSETVVSEDIDSLTCTICSSRTFGTRQELLHHLSLTHFNMLLLQRYPLKDGDLCPVGDCTVQLSNKVVHLLHVGKLHEKVLTFLQTPHNSVQGDHPQPRQTSPESSSKHVENEPILDSDNIVKESEYSQKGSVLKAPCEEQIEESVPESNTENIEASSQNNDVVASMSSVTQKDPIVEDVVKSEGTTVRVQCTLCEKNNKVRTFEKKSDFLKHLSLIHYGKQILTLYPWSLGDRCRFCLESASSKEYRANKKELHVCHVAIMHQKLFELIPLELSQVISAMPATRRTEGRSRPPPAQAVSLQCKYCDQAVPRSEMRDHLISHKTIISQRTNQDFNFSP